MLTSLATFHPRDLEVQGGIRSAEDLRAALQQPRQRAPSGAWRVRWIHVDGLNWDAVQVRAVTSALGLKGSVGARAAEQETFHYHIVRRVRVLCVVHACEHGQLSRRRVSNARPCFTRACACRLSCMQELALHYDLHPLALEDTGGVRVKEGNVLGVRKSQKAS